MLSLSRCARRWAGSRACSWGNRVALEYLDEGRIASVTLNRGDKLNVMDPAFFDELHAVFAEVSGNDEARAAVLFAEGKHFTAGLDLKAAADMFFKEAGNVQRAKFAGAAALGIDASVTEPGMPAMRNQKLHKTILRWQEAISSLQRCRIPVIAAVQGKCIGGGVDLIASADMRVCTRTATFSIKETEVGIVADLGTLQRVATIVGQGVVRELAFTSCDLTAERAEKLGFVNSAHDTEEEMRAAALSMARRVASCSPLAVQGSKEILNHAVLPAVEDGLRHVALHNSAFLKSDDLLRSVAAFVKKQQPSFSDYVLPHPPRPAKPSTQPEIPCGDA